jgi:hypothetical protein
VSRLACNSHLDGVRVSQPHEPTVQRSDEVFQPTIQRPGEAREPQQAEWFSAGSTLHQAEFAAVTKRFELPDEPIRFHGWRSH